MGVMLNSGMFCHQHVSGLANQFPTAISKESAHLLVDQNNRPGLIDYDNSVRRGLKQLAILHFQLLLSGTESGGDADGERPWASLISIATVAGLETNPL